MSFKLKKKIVVMFLKITICFLLSRPFGSIIHDIAARYEGRLNTSNVKQVLKQLNCT